MTPDQITAIVSFLTKLQDQLEDIDGFCNQMKYQFSGLENIVTACNNIQSSDYFLSTQITSTINVLNGA